MCLCVRARLYAFHIFFFLSSTHNYSFTSFYFEFSLHKAQKHTTVAATETKLTAAARHERVYMLYPFLCWLPCLVNQSSRPRCPDIDGTESQLALWLGQVYEIPAFFFHVTPRHGSRPVATCSCCFFFFLSFLLWLLTTRCLRISFFFYYYFLFFLLLPPTSSNVSVALGILSSVCLLLFCHFHWCCRISFQVEARPSVVLWWANPPLSPVLHVSAYTTTFLSNFAKRKEMHSSALSSLLPFFTLSCRTAFEIPTQMFPAAQLHF